MDEKFRASGDESSERPRGSRAMAATPEEVVCPCAGFIEAIEGRGRIS
jgi:hypothetical protein